MDDPRPAMRDELHHLVEIVARKPNGVRALSILSDQANVLANYKSGRGTIASRGCRPRCKETWQKDWEDGFWGR